MQDKKYKYDSKTSTRKAIRIPDDILDKMRNHKDFKNLSNFVIQALKEKLNINP